MQPKNDPMKPPITPLIVMATTQTSSIVPNDMCRNHDVNATLIIVSAVRTIPNVDNAPSIRNPSIAGNRKREIRNAAAAAALIIPAAPTLPVSAITRREVMCYACRTRERSAIAAMTHPANAPKRGLKMMFPPANDANHPTTPPIAVPIEQTRNIFPSGT